MKKSILFPLIVGLSILIITAFKTYDSNEKEFISIYYNDYTKDISISNSNGIFKTVEFIKAQGVGDQTQLLKLIKEYEIQGYKLHAYDFSTSATVSFKSVITVLLTK